MNFKEMVLAAVAMVFAFSAHSGELVKKKDSFAAAPPPNFAMAHAKEGDPCHQSGDIGMSLDGLILSCQSSGNTRVWKVHGSINYLGEWIAGYGQKIKMIHSSKGVCFASGIRTASLNNYDSFISNIYIDTDGYWYVSTVGSYYPRGQTLIAKCIG